VRCSVRCRGSAEGGHSGADRGGGAGAPVDLGELVLGAGEADLESFGFAGPALAVGFGDAGGEVAADLGDAGCAGRGRASAGRTAGRSARGCRGGERTAAGAGGDLAALNRVTGDSLVDRLLSPASHNGANT